MSECEAVWQIENIFEKKNWLQITYLLVAWQQYEEKKNCCKKVDRQIYNECENSIKTIS